MGFYDLKPIPTPSQLNQMTYSKPATPKELRDALCNLKRGEAWRQLCTDKHPSVALFNQLTESLK